MTVPHKPNSVADFEHELRSIPYDHKRMAEYRAEQRRVGDAFRVWIEHEAGTDGLLEESRDAIWSKALSDGHSSGFNEISLAYDELAELVISILNRERAR